MPHPFTIDKLNDSIKNTKNNSAPGHTNIHYLTIKNLGPNSRTLLLQIFNLILITGKILKDWKEGRIYPIPKSKDWQGDINITRPITLLDTSRKIFMKLLNNRLTNALTRFNILFPNNWAGLPGGSTQQPIHI